MYSYPKPYLNASQLVHNLIAKGMAVHDRTYAEDMIKKVGYYRLKGYFFPFYDSVSASYIPGTNFEDVVMLYSFDVELSELVFAYILKIEVALRARLIESLAPTQDVTALNDPSLFHDKKHYWDNHSFVSSAIARSGDIFIAHQYDNHEGLIPVWAAVEVMQYGTLSKLIKNLKTGPGTAYSRLLDFYRFPGTNGNMARPSAEQFSSWVQATSALRNICAHGGRIYNRAMSVHPHILRADAITPIPRSFGAYQEILAMKYLRPDDDSWNNFKADLTGLFSRFPAIDIAKLGFPTDWTSHI